MPERIQIEPTFQAVEVELLGYVFLTKPQTKAAMEKFDAWEEKYEGLDDDAEVEVVSVLGEMYDLMLDSGYPADSGDEEDGEDKKPRKSKPSTVIRRAWEANEIETRALLAGLGQIVEAGRPT